MRGALPPNARFRGKRRPKGVDGKKFKKQFPTPTTGGFEKAMKDKKRQLRKNPAGPAASAAGKEEISSGDCSERSRTWWRSLWWFAFVARKQA